MKMEKNASPAPVPVAPAPPVAHPTSTADARAPDVRYRVVHETLYDYGTPVSLSQQQLHLCPRALEWQRSESQHIDIEPSPSWRADAEDCFGNPVSWVAFHAPHERLLIRSTMTVAIAPHRPARLADSPAWESVRDRLAYGGSAPLREDLEAKGPVKLSEVEAEQKEILKIVRRLADEGQIVLSGKGEEGLVE